MELSQSITPDIVVLDGHTLNPGDLAWTGLEQLGTCVIHDRSEPAVVLPRAANASIVLTNKTPLTREQIAALPKLRYIGVLATGHNIVDSAAAAERRIPVTNVPAYGTRSVAQMTFALILELTQNVGLHAGLARAGAWSRCPDFCFWEKPLVELDGLTLGIVGLGRIGLAVAGLGQAFGMKILATTSSARPFPPGIELARLDDLFRRADVLSLHCPLTPNTRQIVNAERLALMKPTAFLINTSRGPLIDEPALALALGGGRLAGAAVDVLSTEPPLLDNPLLAAPNCLITPHIAWASRAARGRLLAAAVENVRAFLAGTPCNVVN